MSNQSAYAALFEITKRSPRPYRSLIAPSGAAGRGIAFIEDATKAGYAKLSDGTAPLAGFVTRPIVAGGPTLADAIMPNRIELPFSDGTGTFDSVAEANQISLEQAEEVQAEGHAASGYLYSGNGSYTILASTPIGTRCSFVNGKFCIAQTSQVAEYILAEVMTPSVAGNVRGRFTLIGGQVV
jgi:hypothetical protein